MTCARSVRLAPGLAERLLAAADAARPREACGLLAGVPAADHVRVERVDVATNLACSPDRFVLDPGELVAADDAARADGLELVGAWHSHADAPPRPSRADREGAWPGWITLIVGAAGSSRARIAGWRLDGANLVELALDPGDGMSAKDERLARPRARIAAWRLDGARLVELPLDRGTG